MNNNDSDIKLLDDATIKEIFGDFPAPAAIKQTYEYIVDFDEYGEKERELFIKGWTDAGGYLDDINEEISWCRPWNFLGDSHFEASFPTPYEAGKLWWEKCKKEVEELYEWNEKHGRKP